jgi:uncharacterized Zn-binding protein involved in type VI secretion
MPGLTRDGDQAGGTISATQHTVFANSLAVIVDGDPVSDGATMIAQSKNVFVNGKLVVVTGNLSTHNHACNGSPSVNVGL